MKTARRTQVKSNFENTKKTVIASLLMLMMAPGSVSAQDKSKAGDKAASATTAPAEERTSDKMDIKSLEKKYWSAKDDDFTVVQNRAFTKDKRFFAAVMGGMLINDSYAVGTGMTGSIGYHFSERWGMEFSILRTSLKGNDSTTEFIQRYKVAPNHNQTRSVSTLSALWMPIYGKISLLDKKIIYYDMGLGIGIGQTAYEQQVARGGEMKTAPHYSIDVVQQYFFNEHFSIRFDFKNQFSTQQRVKYYLPVSDKNRNLPDAKVQNTFLTIGFTFFY
jgi:outer membrane beta-barrel protein